jgi:integrase/recombinase XerD
VTDELHLNEQLAYIRTFIRRSPVEGTRRAYRRVVREFFQFAGDCIPSEITSDQLNTWRNSLLSRNKNSTVRFKLIVIWSLFEYMLAIRLVEKNPADKKWVRLPPASEYIAGRALSCKEVRRLLAGPDRSTPIGARDYALLTIMLRLAYRASEVCALRASSIGIDQGRLAISVKIKGGRILKQALPNDVWSVIQQYHALDSARRQEREDEDPYIFQPCTSRHSTVESKPLSSRTVYKIVSKYARITGLGLLSPHDLRRTAITRALDQGMTYRQVQMMSGHRNPRTVMIYDHTRECLEQGASNFLHYEDEKRSSSMFARWKRRQLKRAESAGGVAGRVLYAVLVSAIRVRGKPRQKVVLYLGAIRESQAQETEGRMNFWLTVERKVKNLKMEDGLYKKIIDTLSKVVPLPTERELVDAVARASLHSQKK